MPVATLLLAASLFVLEPAAAPLASAPPPASALNAEGFVFVTEDKGVKVYRRDRKAGLEFAAETTIAAAPDRIRKVLTDYPSHPRWQKHYKESRVLARGDGFLDVYQRMTAPVIDDRDYTLHVTWGDDGGVLWMRFVTANDRGPGPVPGVVRISQHEGAFRLEPVDGGKGTKVVYRFSIDIAGSVPVWMARNQAASDIPAYFANVVKQLPGY